MADALDLVKASAELATAMKVFESLEKLSTVAGVLGPIFGVAAAIVKLAMGNVDSPEMKYMKEQFTIVKNKLDVISDQIGEVLREVEKSTLQNQYFRIEENLKNQFRKYMEILHAAPEYREKEVKEFLDHFRSTDGDQNLHTLYDGVMGASAIFGKPILETAMNFDQRNRRLMEGMCSRLKELFCIGLIALMGQTAITGNDEKALQKEWDAKLSTVETKMKSVVDQCVNEFADQAKIDVETMIKADNIKENEKRVSKILTALTKKFDWVYWSVRVYNPVGGFDNHCVTGPNYFHFFRLNDVNCVVSYANTGIPLDIGKIQRLMSGKEGWNDARSVADHISNNMPGHMVHTVRRLKGLWNSQNFPENCHFWENYSGVTLCVHST